MSLVASKQEPMIPADRPGLEGSLPGPTEAETSPPLRVGFYTDTFLPNVGGAEVVLDHLVTQLARRGDHAVVLAPRIRGQRNDDLPYPVYRFRKPFSKRFGVRLALPRLIALHRKHRWQVLHCHAAYPTAYVAAAFKRWWGVPFVVRPHGSDILPGERIRRHPRLERRLRQSLACADAVIAQGQFLKNVLLDFGVDEGRIRIIHNGVHLETFAEAPPYSHPRPYILGLGNLSPRKGFDILLRAYARLEPPRPDLLLAGSGPEQATLAHLAQELGIAGRVRFLGHVAGRDKVSVYRSAQFLVCPSRREPFANVILEALASGLPVVASAVGGNTELVRDGHHGLLCPPDDDEALSAAMRMLIDNSEMAGRFRDSAQRFIRDFDWPKIAEQYRQLYRELATTSVASSRCLPSS